MLFLLAKQNQVWGLTPKKGRRIVLPNDGTRTSVTGLRSLIKEHTMRIHLSLCIAVVCLFATPLFAQNHKIDFEDFAGPSRFDTVQAPARSLSATISGGEVLRSAARGATARTAVYGTSHECAGCSPEISIQFHQRVSNVQVSYQSQQNVDVRYVTEDEQGHLEETTLPESLSAGSGAVDLPYANIRQVTLANHASDFVMTIDAVTFAATATPVLIDPVVAALLSGSAVTTTVNSIAAATTGLVQGVAADGTTQTVLRIPATSVGQTFTVSVINDQGATSTSVPNDGGVMALGASTSTLASSLVVTAVTTSAGAEAFAIYRGPVNFSRGTADNTLTTRGVTLRATPATGTATNTAVVVARPPVVLVHGLWGNASSFNNFTPLITDANFNVSRAVYATTITGVTSTTPSFSSSVDSSIETNSLGFAYNAPSVLAQINNFIASYRTTANVAAVKADIVAHSMGGDISRTAFLLSTYLSTNTFGAGPINKLITIATPHLGTPVAADLLASNNQCARNVLASDGDIALQSVTFSGTTADGAVYDLEGNGYGSSLSTALSNLKATQPFPTSYIAGIATSANLKGLSCIFCDAEALRLLCSGNPLASDLTASKWTTIYGQSNDTIVPLDSALNNLTGKQYSGVIHTAALETLDFDGPSVLDPASTISTEVIALLNEAPTGTDFH
jgi:pimeloyl-ACP methyl ester carboxylesterase